MTRDLTEGSCLKQILLFTAPLLVGNLLQQTYNLVDAAIVGRCLGTDALAAVGASSSVQFMVLGFCIGSCAGFGIPIAQRFGAKDYRAMRSYIFHSILLTALFAVLLTSENNCEEKENSFCAAYIWWFKIFFISLHRLSE